MTDTPEPTSAARAQLLANLHLLTVEEITARLVPALIVRGRQAGSSVLTLGRVAGENICFVLEAPLNAHVMRFRDYQDFRAREAKIRQNIRGNVTVETVFLGVAEAPPAIKPRPAAMPEPRDPEADAQAAADTAWEARWGARRRTLARTADSMLRLMMEKQSIPGDKRAPKPELVETVIGWEKEQAILEMVREQKRLPNVPESSAIAALMAPRRAGPAASASDAEPLQILEPAAGLGAFDESATPTPPPPIPDPGAMATMELDNLQAIAAAHGCQQTRRREIIRELMRKRNPVGAV